MPLALLLELRRMVAPYAHTLAANRDTAKDTFKVSFCFLDTESILKPHAGECHAICQYCLSKIFSGQ